MLPIPGGHGTVIRSLYPADGGVGEELQGETVGAGELPVVREGLSDGVTGCVLPNPKWRSKVETRSGWR